HQRVGVYYSTAFVRDANGFRPSGRPVGIFYFLACKQADVMYLVDCCGPVQAVAHIPVAQLVVVDDVEASFRQNDFWLSSRIVRVAEQQGVGLLYKLGAVGTVSFGLVRVFMDYMLAPRIRIARLQGASKGKIG